MKKLILFEEFETENGSILPSLEIGYSTYGNLNAARNNVVWVLHALTANSEVTEWWPALIGTGCVINPEEHFIICANVLGSCYGSSGPLSTNNITNEKYYHDFPLITIRDMVRAHDELRKYLGIKKIAIAIGGSLGGQQLLEWSITQPLLFEKIILIATNAQHSAYGIAFNESQRLAIEADSTFRERKDNAGFNGLLAARSIALLSYRHYNAYQNAQLETSNQQLSNFKAASYQRYQGEKLVMRFNAFSYYTLSKAMDTHNVGRNRKSIANALSAIKAQAIIIGISNDMLFPLSEQIFLMEHIKNASLDVINSSYGHDGFLIETEKISAIIKKHAVAKCEKKQELYYSIH